MRDTHNSPGHSYWFRIGDVTHTNPNETQSGMLSWIYPEKLALHLLASLRQYDVNLSSSWPSLPLLGESLPENETSAEEAERAHEESPESTVCVPGSSCA